MESRFKIQVFLVDKDGTTPETQILDAKAIGTESKQRAQALYDMWCRMVQIVTMPETPEEGGNNE